MSSPPSSPTVPSIPPAHAEARISASAVRRGGSEAVAATGADFLNRLVGALAAGTEPDIGAARNGATSQPDGQGACQPPAAPAGSAAAAAVPIPAPPGAPPPAPAPAGKDAGKESAGPRERADHARVDAKAPKPDAAAIPDPPAPAVIPAALPPAPKPPPGPHGARTAQDVPAGMAEAGARSPAPPPPVPAGPQPAAAVAAPAGNALVPTPPPAPSHSGSEVAPGTAVKTDFPPPVGAPALSAPSAPARAEAPAAPQPAAPAAPPAPAQQVAPVLLALSRTAEGNGQLVLRLAPDALGQVQIRVERAHDGSATVQVAAERPEALHLLMQDAPVLHRALDQAGLPAEGRSLSFILAAPDPSANAGGAGPGAQAMPGGGQGGQGGGHTPRPFRRGGGWTIEEGEDPPHHALAWRAAGIDITA